MRLLQHMAAAGILFVLTLACGGARADRLVTDISQREIAITSSFQGTNLLIFGAVQGAATFEGGLETSDIVVVVRGPRRPVIVRKKERVAGIWVNTRAVTFADVPGYYAVASSRPLERIISPELQKTNGIGIAALDLKATKLDNVDEADIDAYRDAVVRQRRQGGLFSENEGGVRILAQTLFRANLVFPADVPVGNYRVEAYLLKDGRIVSAQSSPLAINKSGLERGLYILAHEAALFYGIMSVLVAILVGWAAAVVFRRRTL